MTDSSTQPATRGGHATPDKAGQVQEVQDQLHAMIACQLSEATPKPQPDALAEALLGVINGVLPDKVSSPARVRGSRLLARVALGETWRSALEAEGAAWADMAAMTCAPGMYALSEACKAVGYSIKREKAMSALHERAVDGWLEPVYQGGKEVGLIRRHSDRLLELLVAGYDPAKYGKQAGAVAGAGGSAGPVAIQINVVTADRSATSDNPAAPAINITP